MTTGQQIVEQFLRTLESRDLNKVSELVTDDVEYSNPPTPPHYGKRAMLDFLAFNYSRMDHSTCVFHYWAQSEDGEVVT